MTYRRVHRHLVLRLWTQTQTQQPARTTKQRFKAVRVLHLNPLPLLLLLVLVQVLALLLVQVLVLLLVLVLVQMQMWPWLRQESQPPSPLTQLLHHHQTLQARQTLMMPRHQHQQQHPTLRGQLHRPEPRQLRPLLRLRMLMPPSPSPLLQAAVLQMYCPLQAVHLSAPRRVSHGLACPWGAARQPGHRRGCSLVRTWGYWHPVAGIIMVQGLWGSSARLQPPYRSPSLGSAMQAPTQAPQPPPQIWRSQLAPGQCAGWQLAPPALTATRPVGVVAQAGAGRLAVAAPQLPHLAPPWCRPLLPLGRRPQRLHAQTLPPGLALVVCLYLAPGRAPWMWTLHLGAPSQHRRSSGASMPWPCHRPLGLRAQAWGVPSLPHPYLALLVTLQTHCKQQLRWQQPTKELPQLRWQRRRQQQQPSSRKGHSSTQVELQGSCCRASGP
mmetsp:Transcript_33681/g.74590  ORF Transcript_33681/g.74590 Transcript_33681/m.74590 type:complete len:440 (+) Transcript_33681:153-1472(+)